MAACALNGGDDVEIGHVLNLLLEFLSKQLGLLFRAVESEGSESLIIWGNLLMGKQNVI